MDGISIHKECFRQNGLSIEADTSYTFNVKRSDIPPSSKKSPPQSFVSKVLKIVSMRSLISQLKKLVGCLCCVPFSSPSTFACPISDLCSPKSQTFIKTILNLELKISAYEEKINKVIDTLQSHGGENKEHLKAKDL